MNKFDKPYIVIPTIDENKINELFQLVTELDTHKLLNYSRSEHIPLYSYNSKGESLIHEVIKINDNKASEHAKLNVIKFLVKTM